MRRSPNKVSLSKLSEKKSRKTKTNRMWFKKREKGTWEGQETLHLKRLTYYSSYTAEWEKRIELSTAIFSVFTYLRKVLDLRKAFDQTLNFTSFIIFFFVREPQPGLQTDFFRFSRNVRTFTNACVASEAFHILLLMMLWAHRKLSYS